MNLKQFLIPATILACSLQAVAQNVGIGTTSPTNKLSVSGRVDIRDSLAIGIDVPGSVLHLQSSNLSNVPRADIILSRFWISGADNRASAIFHYNNPTTNSDNLAFGVSGNGGSISRPNSFGQIKMMIQANGTIGMGTITPHTSAALEITSGNKGLLIPRLSTADRNAIASPATGLQIFNLDDQCTDWYDGANWIKNCGVKVLGPAIDPGHPTPNSWVQKANFGGGSRYGAVGFSIGGKGYVGTGNSGGSDKKDFWEYDAATNVWTQKANFGGTARVLAVGFSIGAKGYIGTGSSIEGRKNDFWAYNPDSNAWTPKANFGGAARYWAVGFSTDSKGYIGTGTNDLSPLNDFWEYDPSLDTFKRKADFGGGQRMLATGFSNGNKGFIGMGFGGVFGNGTLKKDFWQYDPGSDTWTRKADFGGTGRLNATSFTVAGKSYVGTGYDSVTYHNDFWEYDRANNTWTQKANFGGNGRRYATGFSVGNKGYITGGSEISAGIKSDCWEYLDNNHTGTAFSSTLVLPAGSSVSDGAWTLANGHLYNSNSGNVGIGVTNPYAKLEVSGTTKTTSLLTTDLQATNLKTTELQTTNVKANDMLTTALQTSYFQMTAGAANGYILKSGANGDASWVNSQSLPLLELDPKVGSLSTNRIPRWNGSALADGILYDNGTNIGIGTNTPTLGKLVISSGALTAVRLETSANANALSISGTGALSVDSVGIAGGRFLVKDNGYVGIGATNPNERVQVAGKIAAEGFRTRSGINGPYGSNYFNFDWTGSQFRTWVDGINQGVTSDRRLKDRINTLQNTALDRVMNLRPVDFYYKNVEGTIFTGSPVQQEGFIADELQAVIPSAVNGDKDGLTADGRLQPQTVNVVPIVSVLTKAVQEQQKLIAALQNQNADLLKRLEAVEKK
ncbi:MAG: tail fiber domain-containing protein [Bacteroidota bacterium]